MKNQTNLSPKALKLQQEATLIGYVHGVAFYESPTFGDEAALLAITKEGKVTSTGYYELPSAKEFDDYLEYMQA